MSLQDHVQAGKQYLIVYRSREGVHVYDTCYGIAQRNFVMARCKARYPRAAPWSVSGDSSPEQFTANQPVWT